jgi:hypothetical protein
MPGNNWEIRFGEFAVDYMQVGPADTTRAHANQYLPVARHGKRKFHQFERLPGCLENHRTHARRVAYTNVAVKRG